MDASSAASSSSPAQAEGASDRSVGSSTQASGESMDTMPSAMVSGRSDHHHQQQQQQHHHHQGSSGAAKAATPPLSQPPLTTPPQGEEDNEDRYDDDDYEEEEEGEEYDEEEYEEDDEEGEGEEYEEDDDEGGDDYLDAAGRSSTAPPATRASIGGGSSSAHNAAYQRDLRRVANEINVDMRTLLSHLSGGPSEDGTRRGGAAGVAGGSRPASTAAYGSKQPSLYSPNGSTTPEYDFRSGGGGGSGGGGSRRSPVEGEGYASAGAGGAPVAAATSRGGYLAASDVGVPVPYQQKRPSNTTVVSSGSGGSGGGGGGSASGSDYHLRSPPSSSHPSPPPEGDRQAGTGGARRPGTPLKSRSSSSSASSSTGPSEAVLRAAMKETLARQQQQQLQQRGYYYQQQQLHQEVYDPTANIHYQQQGGGSYQRHNSNMSHRSASPAHHSSQQYLGVRIGAGVSGSSSHSGGGAAGGAGPAGPAAPRSPRVEALHRGRRSGPRASDLADVITYDAAHYAQGQLDFRREEMALHSQNRLGGDRNINGRGGGGGGGGVQDYQHDHDASGDRRRHTSDDAAAALRRNAESGFVQNDSLVCALEMREAAKSAPPTTAAPMIGTAGVHSTGSPTEMGTLRRYEEDAYDGEAHHKHTAYPVGATTQPALKSALRGGSNGNSSSGSGPPARKHHRASAASQQTFSTTGGLHGPSSRVVHHHHPHHTMMHGDEGAAITSVQGDGSLYGSFGGGGGDSAPRLRGLSSSTTSSGVHYLANTRGGSTRSSAAGALQSLGSTKKKKVGGVTFSNNEVSTVCVFEVGDELYVGVQFRRSWIGWVAALTTLVFETTFVVHTLYVYEKTDKRLAAVQMWISVARFLVSIIACAIAVFFNVGVRPLTHIKTLSGALLVGVMALMLEASVACEVVANETTGSTHFFATSVAYCLWIIAFRLTQRQMVFFVEVAAVVVAVVGFILTEVGLESGGATSDIIIGNVVQLVGSLTYAAYFILLSKVRRWAPIVPMAAVQGIVAVLIGLPLGFGFDHSASDLFYNFTSGPIFGHTIAIATEGIISNIAGIIAVDYLDVLSVAAVFLLKSAIFPVIAKFLVYDHMTIPANHRLTANDGISWLTIIGFICAIGGSAVVVVFASLRRSFVTRRIARSKRKQAPNPYNKRRRKLERQQKLQQMQQQQVQLQQQQHQRYHPSPAGGGGVAAGSRRGSNAVAAGNYSATMSPTSRNDVQQPLLQ